MQFPENSRRIKQIRISFALSAITTLFGGIFLLYMHYDNVVLPFVFIPFVISTTISLCKIQSILNKNLMGLIITIVLTVTVLIIPCVIFSPIFENDERIYVKNDTLYVDGYYSKKIPYMTIKSVEYSSKIPKIRMRTNGISFGNFNKGYYLTSENKEIILYSYSETGPFVIITTREGKNFYIRFKDSSRTYSLYNKINFYLYKNNSYLKNSESVNN